MHIEYTKLHGPISYDRDLLEEAVPDSKGDVAADIIAMGYIQGFHVGNSNIATIQLFNNFRPKNEFAALAIVILGEAVEIYAFPSNEDVWDYLKNAVPTVKALAELSLMNFD